MADWGQRAKDRDRDDAIRLIEDAAARGAIIPADKEKRIQEVRSAQTVGEIQLITRGLAAAPVSAGGPAEPTPPGPGTPAGATFEPSTPPSPRPAGDNPVPPSTWAPDHQVQYGEPLTPSAGTTYTPPLVRRRGHSGKLMMIVVLSVVAGIAVPMFFGIKGLVDGIDGIDGIDDIVGGGRADVFSDAGLADLVEAVEEKSGSTEVFELSVFEGYAVVDVPTEATGKRYISYRFDGRLAEFTKSKASEDVRFDLRDVDASVLRDLAAKARRMVEAPTSNYVIIRPAVPPFGNGEVQVLAYASNDFSESGYLEATLKGKVIARHPPS